MNCKLLATIGALLITFQPVYAELSSDIIEVQHRWAKANYETPEDQQEQAFETLTAYARNLESAHPEDAEPKVWLAIVLSSDAGANGGFGALGKVKEARKYLEQAEKIDATVLHGSVYTSLGSLYYQVPGWPIGFGDNDKADSYLQKALAVNPDGIDPNYFYGDFQLEEGNIKQAIGYFEKAQSAQNRPDRPVADKGRQQEIAEKLVIARGKL